MPTYAALDVSMKTTSIHVVNVRTAVEKSATVAAG